MTVVGREEFRELTVCGLKGGGDGLGVFILSKVELGLIPILPARLWCFFMSCVLFYSLKSFQMQKHNSLWRLYVPPVPRLLRLIWDHKVCRTAAIPLSYSASSCFVDLVHC